MTWWVEDESGYLGDLATTRGLFELRKLKVKSLNKFLDTGLADPPLIKHIIKDLAGNKEAAYVRKMLMKAKGSVFITDGVGEEMEVNTLPRSRAKEAQRKAVQSSNSENEKFYIFQHPPILGCLNPKCGMVYTEQEIQDKETSRYIKTHLYLSTPVSLCEFESTAIDRIDLHRITTCAGWTPRYLFEDNGFELLIEIDLFDLFAVNRYGNALAKVGAKFRESPGKIKERLKSLHLGNTPVLVFRTLRGWPAIWDTIDVFGIGRYHSEKSRLRRQLSRALKKS